MAWKACARAASVAHRAPALASAIRYGAIVLMFTGVVSVSHAQLADIVLDCETTTAPHTITISGTWTADSSTAQLDRHGASYLKTGTHSADRWVRFQPSIPTAGWYRVYLWTPANSNFASNPKLEIQTADGEKNPTVNLRQNGGKWRPIGTFRFDAGTTGYVTINARRADESTVPTNGTVVADAVRFQQVEPELVLDNGDPGVTQSPAASWISSANTTVGSIDVAAVNGNFLHDGTTGANGSFTRSIEYRPNIPVAGRYQVYITWPASPVNSPNAHVDVYSASGDQPKKLSIDQRGPGYEGLCIGTFDFLEGSNGRVVISNRYDAIDGESLGRVVADSVRFVRVPGSIANSKVVVDQSSSGAVATGTWVNEVSALSDRLGLSHDTDNDPTTKGGKSYLFTPTLTHAGYYSVYAWWPADASYSSIVPIEVNTAAGLVSVGTVNQRLNGGKWNFVGKWWFNSGATGSVRIKNNGANGYVVADGVAFVRGDDGDEDGIPDSWEVTNGLNPGSAADAGVDTDGDGFTNLQEYQMGTDPQDFYNGVPAFLSYISGDNQFSDPNTFAPQPLVIEVRDSNQAGAPLLSNAPVSFTVQSGGGLLAPSVSATPVPALTVWTDGVGRAQVYFKQPNTNGTDSSVQAVAGKNTGASNAIPFSLHSNLLVGFWKFDENSGTSAFDSSPSIPRNNGTVSTGATFEQSFDYVAPTADNALRFNGTTGYVNVLNSSTLAFSGVPFSVSAWVKLNAGASLEANTDVYPIVSKWTNTTGAGGFEFAIKGGSGNGLSFRTFSSGVLAQEVVPMADYRALFSGGVPHLVTFTRDSSKVGRLYIDGVEVGSTASVTASLTSTASLTIGWGNGGGTGRYFAGVIDDLRLLGTALKAQEIASAFSSDGDSLPDWWEKKYFGDLSRTDSGNEDGDLLNNQQEYLRGTNPTDLDSDDDGFVDGEDLVGFWKFNETSGSLVSDSSPAVPKNNGTLNASGWTREQSFDYVSPGPDNAIRFDGAAGFITVSNSATLVFSGSTFSASAWIKLNSGVSLAFDTDVYPIVSKWNGTGGGLELLVRGGNSGKGLSFRSYSNGTVAQEIIPLSDCRSKLSDGLPHLVVYTRDANNLGRLYLDGTEVGVATSMPASFNSAASLLIAKNNNSRYFPGLIEDLKLHTRTMGVQEIANAFSSDGDTLPDWWEKRYFGNLSKLGTGDDDTGGGDGLSNLLEYQLGTNPALRDTDGDGLTDGDEDSDLGGGDGLTNLQEVQLGTNPVLRDTDGDGLTDGEEVSGGFNPTASPVNDTNGSIIGLTITTPLE